MFKGSNLSNENQWSQKWVSKPVNLKKKINHPFSQIDRIRILVLLELKSKDDKFDEINEEIVVSLFSTLSKLKIRYAFN